MGTIVYRLNSNFYDVKSKL